MNIRTIHARWLEMDHRDMNIRAGNILKERLASYEKPGIDPVLEKSLKKYVEQKKAV